MNRLDFAIGVRRSHWSVLRLERRPATFRPNNLVPGDSGDGRLKRVHCFGGCVKDAMAVQVVIFEREKKGNCRDRERERVCLNLKVGRR